MNKAVRRVAIACVLLFLALLANDNYLQVYAAGSLKKNPHDVRSLYQSFDHQRGPIVVAGKEVARSVPTNDRLKYLRTYPGGPEYAHVTGYYSFVVGSADIEHQENDVLDGADPRLFVKRVSDLITGRKPQGGAVYLTLDPKAQAAAWHGLKGKKGAVVALDPSTGKILALASSPSYDPSTLTTHDPAKIQAQWAKLVHDPGDPLLDRALSQTYPPGSLFKVVTTAAALTDGYAPQTVVPAPHVLQLPQTSHGLHNYGNEVCAPSGKMPLIDALRISCNTAYGALGLKLGWQKLNAMADAFGFDNGGLQVPMPVATSVFPDDLNPPQTAQSAIGQYDVRLTPLQAAMVAAAVANHGVLMKPYLVDRILAPDLSVVDQTTPQRLSTPISPQVAQQLTTMMQAVVEHGTGTAAQIPGVSVAGKTGTAQHGGGAPHAWFIAFAPADHPQVAVAVLVENGGSVGAEATGGRVAAPIAKAVMEAVLGK